ncbi:MAG: hypothetical protein LIP09_15440 [Bacteroidales bacterium]|nr:hypothetical protein [Bacteroidales bacterium]
MPNTGHNRRIKRAQRLIGAVLAIVALPLLLPALSPRTAPPSIFRPQVPLANRNDDKKVFLEHADVLHKEVADSYLVLTGNVQFSKGGMMMYCDSAHFYPDNESLDAFSNVRMEQGDTLKVTGDSMIYRSDTQLAWLFGSPARMTNRDVTLVTDEFIYDMYSEFGYYTVGGVLTDAQNRLVSIEGEYVPSTKEAVFYTDVRLNSLTENDDSLYIYTDTLYYNTDTHLSELFSPSLIINKSDTIFTTNGTYDTETKVANLFERSLVRMGRGTTLEGDTLFYDRTAGYGWARGNMVLTDSAKQSSLSGAYGYYDQNIDSTYVTGRAMAREYSQGDTLYLHGREIFSFRTFDTISFPEDTIRKLPAYERVDTNHVMVCYPRVRFFRSDMQGVCDSMRFEERDSTLYMYRHPIVWNEARQIFGNVIELHMNDSTIDRATLPDFGFSAEQVEGEFFNQLSGKEMIAYFENGEMNKLDVNGNVEAIMLPQENDSTYNKILNIESSYMTADFEGQDLLKMKMWPETSGTVTPLYLAKKSLFYLSKFKWYTGIRPVSPEDIFIIPPEMEELMQQESTVPVAKKKKQRTGTPVSANPQKPSQPQQAAKPAGEDDESKSNELKQQYPWLENESLYQSLMMYLSQGSLLRAMP